MLGPGDNTITIAGQTHRRYYVTAPQGTPMAFEPPRFFLSCFVSSAMNRLYFHVPEGTAWFSKAR